MGAERIDKNLICSTCAARLNGKAKLEAIKPFITKCGYCSIYQQVWPLEAFDWPEEDKKPLLVLVPEPKDDSIVEDILDIATAAVDVAEIFGGSESDSGSSGNDWSGDGGGFSGGGASDEF